MKTIKISLILLILSISISCEKKEEEPITLTLSEDVQNGVWEATNGSMVLKFDGTTIKIYQICIAEDCSPNFPCVEDASEAEYLIENNLLTIDGGIADFPIKIEGDVLTITDLDGEAVFHRKPMLAYPDC